MFAPLAGVRVVDVTTSLAGPYCTWILAALGADVVKVERPGTGDDTRSWGPPFWEGESATFLALNAGKRSAAIDLKQADGVRLVRRLVARADVFVQNLRPGLADRLGLGFEELRHGNDRLVYCTIGAFGRRGPESESPGYDPLMQAAAGIMSITGEPDRPPARAGPSIVDQGTGMWAALAVLAALRERDRADGAQLIDTSLFETALNWVPYQLAGTLATGRPPAPHGSGIGIIAPYQAFRACDRWLMVAAGNDRLFARLCLVLDRETLIDDARFRTNPDRVAHRDELAVILAEKIAERPRDHWLDELRAAGVPAAAVQDLAEVLESEQVAALDILRPIPHPTIPDLRLVMPPISVGEERVAVDTAPPGLGEHTGDVLRDAGYDDGETADLMARGVVA